MRYLWLLLSLLFIPLHAQVIKASAEPTILFFSKEGCLHCAEARDFLEGVSTAGITFTVQEVSVNTRAGRQQFAEYQTRYHFPATVPVLLITTADVTSVIVGFNTAADSGEQIKRALSGEVITINDDNCAVGGDGSCAVAETVSLPFLGTISLASFSLPLVTILIGLADGFNPCAMWSLVALLGFLLAQKSRRKLLVIGGSFLITSFLFSWFVLFGWYRAFSFALNLASIGFEGWWQGLTYLIYGLALYLGVTLLRAGLAQSPQACAVEENKSTITKKMAVIGTVWWPYAIVLAVLLAIFVNFIELLCSIGLPVIYTKYLNDLSLGTGTAASYITLYTVFYMLDDLLVFAGAVLLSRVIWLSPRFSRWVKILTGLSLIGVILWQLWV